MKKLYFIRHGLTEMNVQRLVSGITETPLTDEGRSQALKTGQIMKSKELKIDLILSSPLSRALETAQIIAGEIGYPKDEIIVNELLIERDYGEGEGTVWSPDRMGTVSKGAETNEVLVKRARKALNWIESLETDNILVVSHGAIGRALRSIVLKDFPMSHPHKLANAELYEWL